MDAYYVNKKAQPESGDHEVHKEGCKFMPFEENRLYLGSFDNCHDAVAEARKTYPDTADGCYFCCEECHTG